MRPLASPDHVHGLNIFHKEKSVRLREATTTIRICLVIRAGFGSGSPGERQDEEYFSNNDPNYLAFCRKLIMNWHTRLRSWSFCEPVSVVIFYFPPSTSF